MNGWSKANQFIHLLTLRERERERERNGMMNRWRSLDKHIV